MIKQYIKPFKLKSRNNNSSDIGDIFESIYSTIISNLQKPLGIG